MNKLVLLLIGLLLNTISFGQLTAEQQRIYNNLSPAEKKKFDDKINSAYDKMNDKLMAIELDERKKSVLNMKPFSDDSVKAIFSKINKTKKADSYTDFLVYKNGVVNRYDSQQDFDAVDSSYFEVKNTITPKILSTASARVVFYYYKNIYDYAGSMFRRAKYQQALNNYIEAAEYYKSDSSYFFAARCGNELIGQGVSINKASVLENFNKSVTLNPNADLFISDRGIFYLNKLNDTSRAIADFTKAVTLNPNADVSFQYLGLIQYYKNNYKDAINYISKSIAIDKYNSTYYLQRGIYYESLRALPSALQDYDEAILLELTNAKYYRYRANCNFQMKNYPDAYDDYGFATMLDPKDEASKKQLQKLDPLLKEAYEKDGFTLQNGFQYFMNRADKQAKLSNGFHQGRAVMNYYKCIQLEPKNPIPYNKAGNIFRVFKMNGPAEQFLRYAAYADGKKASYFEDLGIFYATNKDYKAALGCYDTAALIGSTNADTYSMIGSIRFSLKEYEASLKAYSKSISLDPSHMEVRYMRALVYMDNFKNYQAALADLEAVVKAEPNNQEYLQTLKDCKEKLKK